MRLRTKLLAGSLFMAFSLWPVAWYAEQASRDALEDLLVERATHQASDVLDEVLRVEDNHLHDLEVFVQQPQFLQHVTASNEDFERMKDVRSEIDRLDAEWRSTPEHALSPTMVELLENDCAAALDSYQEVVGRQHGYAVFGEIFVTNRFGANVGQTGRTSDFRQDDEEWWQLAVERGVHIGNLHYDHSAGVVSTDICIRIDHEGELAGVLKAVLDIRSVNQILELRAQGSDTRLVLFDRVGAVVHDTLGGGNETVDMARFAGAPRNEVGVSVLHATRSQGGSDLVAALATDAEGIPNDAGWKLLVEVPTDEVLAPARELGRRIMWVACLATVIGSALGLWLSLSTARRVEALRAATNRIRDGELAHRVEDGGQDELGYLAAGFNDMASGLEAARQAVETARAAKDSFLANMSHEIRTPLTAIIGAIDLLSEPDWSESERKAYFHTIRTSSQHLVSLINDVLDLSKIEAGKLTIEHVPCSPALLAHEVVELLSHQAASKGLELDLGFETPVPAAIESDPTRIRQVLVNLVGNAIKFTDTGGVKIDLAYEPGAIPSVRFSVVDTGIGIDNEKLERIFRPFEQADMSTTRRFGGTGLGLAISRKLASALGGELSIRTGPDGSTFTLTVATNSVATKEVIGSVAEVERYVGSELPEETPSELRGLRVLLVEDVPVNRKLIATMLSRRSVEVIVAENGLVALDLVEEANAAGKPFDLILMDLMMPELDGWKTTSRLRESGHSKPIVALTADATRETANRCLGSGFDEVATKPVRSATLLRTVKRLTDKPNESRESA